MKIEDEIAICSDYGHQLLLRFSKFDRNFIPKQVLKEIINIDLIRIDQIDVLVPVSINNEIAYKVLEYLNEYDVILYFFYDTKMIKMSNRRDLSNQEYRSKLFSTLAKKHCTTQEYYEEVFEIEENTSAKYYIHLISRTSNKDQILAIRKELNELNK